MRPDRPPQRWRLAGSSELAEGHRPPRLRASGADSERAIRAAELAKLLAVACNRPPAWRYLPPTGPRHDPGSRSRTRWPSWGHGSTRSSGPARGTGGRINTKLITRQLESYLPADPAGVLLDGGLLHGWNVETRDPLARIPLLYGENGRPLYGASPDAIGAADDGYRALLDIEGGGAVQNNRLMKDVVETLLIPDAHHLALAVPHSIHGRSPYDFATNLISALYPREVPHRHVRGILAIGY
jgi:hypothetical protein